MVCLLPLGGKGQELKLVRGLGAPGSGSPATGLSSVTGWRIGRHLALIFSSLVEGQKLPGLDLCCWKKDKETAGTTSTGGGACALLPGVGWGMDWLPGFCCYHSCRQTSCCWHMWGLYFGPLGFYCWQIGPTATWQVGAWGVLTHPNSAVITTGVGRRWVGPQILLVSQLLLLGTSHPTKSLLSFPFLVF